MSTGQGLLGNNMFAYCGNNPVNCYDPSGNAYQGIYSQINYSEFEHSYGGHRENGQLAPQEFHLGLRKLESYNVVSVIEVPFGKDSAFSFGAIFVGSNVSDNPELLAHEYGHILQLREIGTDKYLIYVVVPSVTCYALTSCGILSWDNYYDRPWELIADLYGRENAYHSEQTTSRAEAYWSIVKSIEIPYPPFQ